MPVTRRREILGALRHVPLHLVWVLLAVSLSGCTEQVGGVQSWFKGLLPGVFGGTEKTQPAGGAADPGTGPLPQRRRRVFVSNSTGPQAERAGFRFPREDARVHDGDELQLYSGSHKTWVSLESSPMQSIRGSVSMKLRSTGKYCLHEGTHLKCSFHEVAHERVVFEDAGWGNKFGLIVNGKYCSDTAHGISCNIDDMPKGIGGWEAFEMIPSGDGSQVLLRGARHSKFCSEHGSEGLLCDTDDKAGAAVFTIEPDEPLPLVLAQTTDKSKAATFVVERADLKSGEIALQCKGHSRYAIADPDNGGRISCTSKSPAPIQYVRLSGQQWWNAHKGSFKDPKSGKFWRAEHADWGASVDAHGDNADGWQLLDINLVAGYETIYPMVRGVNLGSWLLLERWMSEELFKDEDGEDFTDECVGLDEEGLLKQLSPGTRKKRMEEHWETWFTEEDVKWIHDHGINTVRIPFGFWITKPEEPFVDGSLKYLERLFEWCEKHEVAVLLDFHGLKGSQSGGVSTGNCGACGKPQCGTTKKAWLEKANQATNLAVIEELAARFSDSPVYLGFGVANEVGVGDSHEAMRFYQKAIDIIRSHSSTALIFLDATWGPHTYPFEGEHDMAVDDHVYFSARFDDDAGANNGVNMDKAVNRLMNNFRRWPVVVGEWSLDHHGFDLAPLSSADKEEWNRYFAKAQLQAYEQHTMGWIYWSYKTAWHWSTWNYKHMCEEGIMPGCTGDFEFAADNWWDSHVCAFTYLDNTHLGEECSDKHLML